MLTKEQRAMRRSMITASDVPAILGLSPWATQYDVYREKVLGEEDESEPQYHQLRGHAVEPFLISWLGRQTELDFRHNASTMRHPRIEWVGATPDGLARKGRKIIAVGDAKYVDLVHTHRWLDECDLPAPADYVVAQVHWQMFTADVREGYVVAELRAEQVPRIHRIDWDDELGRAMFDAASRFWVDTIVAKRPPQVDGSPSSDEMVTALFRRPKRAELIQATPQLDDIGRELVAARARLKAAEAEEAALETVIKAAIGDATGIEGFGWRALWPVQRGNIAWKQAFDALGPKVGAEVLDQFRGRDFRKLTVTSTASKKARAA